MNNIIHLFNLQINERVGNLKKSNFKKMLLKIMLYISIIAVAYFALDYFTRNMRQTGIIFGNSLFSIVLLFTQIISLIISVSTVINVLYTSKDNQLLMSLPVSSNQLFISKLLVIYVTELLTNVLYTFPIFLFFANRGSLDGSIVLSGILMIFILPILPLAISAFISLPIYYLTKLFKKHPTLSIITILVLSCVCIYFYSNVMSGFNVLLNLTSQQYDTVVSINNSLISFANKNFLYKFITDGMTNISQIWKLFIVLLGSLALMVIAVLICKPFFFKVALSSSENVEKSKKYKKSNEIMNPFKSLLIKEFRTTFRSPDYVVQYFLFTLLMPVIVVLYDKLMRNITVSSIGYEMIDGAHIIVILLIASMSNIVSTSAISREGVNFYLMKTTPVDPVKQCFMKIIFNAIITLVSLIVTCIVSSFFYDYGLLKTLLTIISVCSISLGHIALCFGFDLMHPSVDWYDSSEIESLSKNAVKGMISGLAISIIAGLILMLNANHILSAYLVLTLLSISFGVICLYMLKVRIHYYFKRMEV